MASPSDTTTKAKTSSSELRASLETIGLRRIAVDLDDFVARATKARWSIVQQLEEIVRLETQERASRSVERRLARAHLGRFKPMADFD